MFSSLSLSFCFLLVIRSTQSVVVDQLESCNRECEKDYDNGLESACQHGCRRAEALHIVPGTEQPVDVCQTSCSSAFPGKSEMDACNHGCAAYPAEVGSLFGSLLTLLSNLKSFGPSVVEQNDTSTPSEETFPKTKVVVIRRIRFHLPNEDQPDSDDMAPEAEPFPLIPSGLFSMLNKNEPLQPVADNLHQNPPQVLTVSKSEPTHTSEVTHVFQYLGSHPLTILFGITLLALLILIVVQLVVEYRRRRRSSQFQYNKFDQLPSYVEATTIKVPVDSDATVAVSAETNTA